MTKKKKSLTREEKVEFLETIKHEERRYTIALTGYGGEIAIGRITKEQYEFWEEREDLSDHVTDWNNELEVPDELKICSDGAWYDRDDLIHENGVEFSELCYITVYDEEENEIFQSSLSYSDLEDAGVDLEGMNNEEFYVQYDSDADYAFLGQSVEKGTFFTGEFVTRGKFDPAKLNFSVKDIEGWELVNGVSYESVIVEDTGGYDTTGKSSDYKVFRVER